MTEAVGTLPKALMAGVRVWWGQDYDTHPEFWSKCFEKDTSEMNHEEDVELGGTGLATIQTDGGSTSYDNMRQGPTTSYSHMRYSLGFIVTEDEFDDNQYVKVARARTTSLAFSFRTTKEVVAANTFNRAATSGYTGGDGVTLLSTAHPRLDGATWANRTTAFADISEAAVEDLLKLMMAAENTMGHPIPLRAKRLVVSTDNGFEATRIVKSTLQSGNANNDTNAMREMGIFQEDPMIHPYFTDMDAWGVITDAPNGLKMYQRKNRIIRRESDFDTDNLKVKGVERYSFGWSDPRGYYGSSGAG